MLNGRQKEIADEIYDGADENTSGQIMSLFDVRRVVFKVSQLSVTEFDTQIAGIMDSHSSDEGRLLKVSDFRRVVVE